MNDQQFQMLMTVINRMEARGERMETRLNEHMESAIPVRVTVEKLDSQHLNKRVSALEMSKYKLMGFLAASTFLGGSVVAIIMRVLAPLG